MTSLTGPSATCGFIPRELDALETQIGETHSLISLLTEKLSPLVTPPKLDPAGQKGTLVVDGAERSQIANRIDDIWEQVTRQNMSIKDLIARIDV